jgi:acyl-CoA hydrolase
MKVFVKVVAEDLYTSERRIAATSFLKFVALDENRKPIPIPQVIPETDEEKKLDAMAPERAQIRRTHREASKEFAKFFMSEKPARQANPSQ